MNIQHHMMPRRLLLLLTMVAALSACGDVITSPDLFPRATARHACGPGDSPAVRILLARDFPPPQLVIRLTIWHELAEIGERTFWLEYGSSEGYAEYFSVPATPTSLHVPLKGRVHVRRVESDTTIVGFVDVQFPDGTRFARTFSAQWQATPGNTCLVGSPQ
jgi:hypothetical protein